MTRKRREGYFNGYKNTQLFFQTWELPKAKMNIVITHGHGEHSECYHRLIDFFQDSPINFYAWDLRGHGRSEGKRGYVENFNDYIYDFEILLKEIQTVASLKTPTILLAHSLGGLIQNKFLISNPKLKFKAQILSSPLFGFSIPVPTIKDKASRLLNLVLPKVTLWNEITNEMLTRDEKVKLEFDKDHLRHGLISSGLYLGMVENIKLVMDQCSRIKISTFIQTSEEDPVVSFPAVKEFYQNLGTQDKKIVIYSDHSKHEIYNDIHRETVFKDLNHYLEGILTP